MIVSDEGTRALEKREGRARLSVRDPLVESLLAGLGFEGEELDRMRAFCKRICRVRNQWDIERRQGDRRLCLGLFGSAVRS